MVILFIPPVFPTCYRFERTSRAHTIKATKYCTRIPPSLFCGESRAGFMARIISPSMSLREVELCTFTIYLLQLFGHHSRSGPVRMTRRRLRSRSKPRRLAATVVCLFKEGSIATTCTDITGTFYQRPTVHRDVTRPAHPAPCLLVRTKKNPLAWQAVYEVLSSMLRPLWHGICNIRDASENMSFDTTRCLFRVRSSLSCCCFIR